MSFYDVSMGGGNRGLGFLSYNGQKREKIKFTTPQIGSWLDYGLGKYELDIFVHLQGVYESGKSGKCQGKWKGVREMSGKIV